MPDDEHVLEVTRCANRLAASLKGESPTGHDAPAFDADYRELLRAVSRLDARFAFDRDGRPGAINAVREALPMMERDLFDAVLEDQACELAAVEEALYQFALALARARK